MKNNENIEFDVTLVYTSFQKSFNIKNISEVKLPVELPFKTNDSLEYIEIKVINNNAKNNNQLKNKLNELRKEYSNEQIQEILEEWAGI